MKAKLSQTVTGAKSFFLRAVDPFFKGKDGKGTSLPIKVTGTKDHPSFGLDLHRKNDKAEIKDEAAKTEDVKSQKTARE